MRLSLGYFRLLNQTEAGATGKVRPKNAGNAVGNGHRFYAPAGTKRNPQTQYRGRLPSLLISATISITLKVAVPYNQKSSPRHHLSRTKALSDRRPSAA